MAWRLFHPVYVWPFAWPIIPVPDKGPGIAFHAKELPVWGSITVKAGLGSGLIVTFWLSMSSLLIALCEILLTCILIFLTKCKLTPMFFDAAWPVCRIIKAPDH